MSFFDRLLGREEQPDKTQGNWYDPEPQATRHNYSPNRLINGGLRDFLGALADAHADSQGMDRVYAPKREGEQVGEAMQGFATNPLEAIQKLSAINPKLAEQFHSNYVTEKLGQGRIDNAALNAVPKRETQVRTLVGGLLRSAKGPAREAALKQAQVIASRAGISLDDLPTDLDDPQALADWTYGTMPVKEQEMVEHRGEVREERNRHNVKTETQGDEKIGIAHQNADNNTIRTNTDRQYKKAGVIDRAAKTTIAAAKVGEGGAARTATRAQAAANAESRNKLARDRMVNSVTASIIKANPGATIQVHPRTGKVRYKVGDGDWQLAN